jgi:type I restriction-modification system DNA methylase subunit
MPTPFGKYMASIETDLRGGKATEYTYRSALETLMETLDSGIEASNDPKHIACGAPDFVVERGKVPLGYVETKDVGAGLDKIEKTDQMRRYLKALNNLILTDYLEFRWYVNGTKKLVLRVAEIGAKGKLVVAPNAEENLIHLFQSFYATETPTVTNAKELAERLASVTKFIRDLISDALTSGGQTSEFLENSEVSIGLMKRYNAFRELLLPALKPEEFSDLYAQTMTYGLFAAKLSSTPAPSGLSATSPKYKSDEPQSDLYLPQRGAVLGEGRVGAAAFTLQSAYQFLFGNKFLRRLFSDVSEELDEIEIIRSYLEDIVSLLNRADFASILSDFGRRTKTEDPVVHFYETFLAAYDPKLRESRGVYYTPEPVVQFIVNAVDELLKTRFGKSWGLADGAVKLLDPATGTGTFLFYVILKIYEEVVNKRKQAGLWPQKSKELLGRVFGFELLIAPYVVSHLKLGLLLKQLDAPLIGRDERLHIYLTNTLEEGVMRAEQLAGLGHYIAEEASDAAQVKKQAEIMVVIGNPPYSGHSANASVDKNGQPNFIGKLIREYYFVDGAPLGERNPKWLQDDYVKFIRFGEWRIEQTGYGVLAFITNHGYLDNPTFRGMRQHLMKTFDEIYVLDLHGNSKKKEQAPDGGKDENVFDIQQGVAILLAVKRGKSDCQSDLQPAAVVKHASLYGLRETKYAILRDSALQDIDWKPLAPDKPFYLFSPQNIDLRGEYEQGWKITDAMPQNLLGFQTHRDPVAIAMDESTLRHQVTAYLKYQPKNWQKWCQNCLYRPFDVRKVYLEKDVTDRPRLEVTRHLFEPNLALNLVRQTKAETWEHALVSDKPTPATFLEIKDGSSIFPLYLYTTPEETAGTLFAQSETTRRPNLAPGFIAALEQKLGLKFSPLRPSATSPKYKSDEPQSDLYLGEAGWGRFTPEDIFHYAYAIFHSPTYRSRYAEFLKIDFPRLPLTSDRDLFFALAEKGRELVELHLLKSAKVEEFITSYPVAGDNRVEKVAFARPDKSHQVSDDNDARVDKETGQPELLGDLSGLLWINNQQYFGNIPESVWNFKVGGYQVCEKWLKDRKGRVLTGADIAHYQRVIVALAETMRLMGEIDESIPGWPLV